MIQLKARFGDGTTLIISVPDFENCTVKELKELIQSSRGASEDGMRLVYKGRILQHDEGLLSEYQVAEGEIIHVAKTRTTPTNTAPPRTNELDPLEGMLNSPMMQSMLSNPELMRSLMQSDPRLQQLREQHPEIRQAMDDPGFLRQMSEIARNPRLRQEMMRNQDRALANIENIPGGFQHLSSVFASIDSATQISNDPSTEEANRLMASRLGVSPTLAQDSPNSQPLPNPWAAPRSQGVPPGFTMMGMPTGPRPTNGGAPTPAIYTPRGIPGSYGGYMEYLERTGQLDSNGLPLVDFGAYMQHLRETGQRDNLPIVTMPVPASLMSPSSVPSAPSSGPRPPFMRNGPRPISPYTFPPTAESLAGHPINPYPNYRGPLNSTTSPTSQPSPANPRIPNYRGPLNSTASPTSQPSPANPRMNPFPFMPGFQATPNAASPNGTMFNMPPNPFLMMQQMMQSANINPQPSEPVEVRYREQLQTLRDMGFTNDEQNKRAILAAAGNTEAAIAYMLDQ